MAIVGVFLKDDPMLGCQENVSLNGISGCKTVTGVVGALDAAEMVLCFGKMEGVSPCQKSL